MTESSALRVATCLCAAILVFAALFLARSVFAPLCFALFVIAMVWPVQRRLQAFLPSLLALLITTAATALVVGVFGALAVWGFTRVGRGLLADSAGFQILYDQTVAWLEAHGIAVAGFWSEHLNVGRMLRLFQEVAAWVNGLVTFSVVVLVYVVLGLLEVDVAARKLRAHGGTARLLAEAGAITAAKLRRYMLVRTQMSVVTGALVYGFAHLVGLELAAEWGIIAFTLNYIPFIGPLIATIFPTLFAVGQFHSARAAILVFAGLNVIQFVVGSYVEPRVSGKSLAMSPFVVLFSVFFWAFLWGVAGAFIGLPITIAALTLCAQHPSTRRFADLLSG